MSETQSRTAPAYWMYDDADTRAAVKAYLFGRTMTDAQVTAMRTYLGRWIEPPPSSSCGEHASGMMSCEEHASGMTRKAGGEFAFAAGLVELRQGLDHLKTRRAIAYWLKLAERLGINPV